MNISVFGCGRWGSFMAWYLDKIGHRVTLFGRSSSEKFKEISSKRGNEFLSLQNSVKITSNLECALADCGVILISISSQNLRSFIQDIVRYQIKDKAILLCMKGLEASTGKRLSQVVKEHIPLETKVAVWVGPGHVQSLVKGIPNCMVIDSDDDCVKKMLVPQLSSNLIRIYYGCDLVGSEVGAAAKNVMGIAAGVLDGLNLTPLKGALMSRGAKEISKLIKAMGGNEMSAYGLCHLGDYQATLFSDNSNNLKFGKSLVTGQKYSKLAEGVSTSTALVLLAEQYGVDLPICKTVNRIVLGNMNASAEISKLFLRSIKKEF